MVNEAALQNLLTTLDLVKQTEEIDPEVFMTITQRGLSGETLAELCAVVKQTEELWQRWRAVGATIQMEARTNALVM